MAWSLICDHPKLAASISSRQLLLCKCFLATNMAEQSPAIRLTILTGLKKVNAHCHCNFLIHCLSDTSSLGYLKITATESLFGLHKIQQCHLIGYTMRRVILQLWKI